MYCLLEYPLSCLSKQDLQCVSQEEKQVSHKLRWSGCDEPVGGHGCTKIWLLYPEAA